MPRIAVTWAVRSAAVKPPGAGARAGRDSGQHGADPGLVQIDPANAGGAELGGQRQLIEGAIGDEANVDAVQHGAEPLCHTR